MKMKRIRAIITSYSDATRRTCAPYAGDAERQKSASPQGWLCGRETSGTPGGIPDARHGLHKILACALLLALCGCTERELEIRPEESVLHIDLRYPGGSGVTASRIWLYGEDGRLRLCEACPAGGWEGRVPTGTYAVLAANDDRTAVVCGEEGEWQNVSLQAEREEDGTLRHIKRVFRAGERAVAVQGRETRVSMGMKSAERRISFRIYPHGTSAQTGKKDVLSHVLSNEKTNESHNKNRVVPRTASGDISEMTVHLTGVVPSIRIADGNDAGVPAAGQKAPARNDAGSIWTADMTCFGWRGDNRVTLSARHSDGSTAESLPIDIGEKIAGLPPEGGVIEVVGRWPDGEPIGLTVTVREWSGGGTGQGTVE